jgi:hypothetical protein
MSKRRGHNHDHSAHGEGIQPLPEWPQPLGEARLPLVWQRRILFVKGLDADDAAYVVLRDSVEGGASQWQMWSYSRKIGDPAETADLDSFLADEPGENLAGPRTLQGNRFTAVGQFDVDLEYFVAAPAETPRTTLRNVQSWNIGVLQGYVATQDLLLLQLADSGTYYVVLFPRDRQADVPEFSLSPDGKVIRVRGAFGEDYVLLSERQTEARMNAVGFRGTAGSVLHRAGMRVLNLGSAGRIADGDLSLECDGPVTLHVESRGARVTPVGAHPDIRIRVTGLPDDLVCGTPGVEFSREEDGAVNLLVPAAVSDVRLLPAGE